MSNTPIPQTFEPLLCAPSPLAVAWLRALMPWISPERARLIAELSGIGGRET